MPAAKAVLRRRRCSARSKRSGERCGQFAMVGAATCYHHGGSSGQSRRTAALQELLAEVRLSWPSGSPVEVAAVALGLQQLAVADELAGLDLGGPLDPEQRERLQLAAARLGAVAKMAGDLGVVVDGGERAAEERGQTIVELMTPIAHALLVGLGSPRSDYVQTEVWLRERALPAALRGEPVPPCPKAWVAPLPLPSLPMLESGSVVKARAEREQREAVREALGAPGGPSAGSGTGEHPGAAPGPSRRGSRGRSEPELTVQEQERAFVEANGLARRAWPSAEVFR